MLNITMDTSHVWNNLSTTTYVGDWETWNEPAYCPCCSRTLTLNCVQFKRHVGMSAHKQCNALPAFRPGSHTHGKPKVLKPKRNVPLARAWAQMHLAGVAKYHIAVGVKGPSTQPQTGGSKHPWILGIECTIDALNDCLQIKQLAMLGGDARFCAATEVKYVPIGNTWKHLPWPSSGSQKKQRGAGFHKTSLLWSRKLVSQVGELQNTSAWVLSVHDGYLRRIPNKWG